MAASRTASHRAEGSTRIAPPGCRPRGRRRRSDGFGRRQEGGELQVARARSVEGDGHLVPTHGLGRGECGGERREHHVWRGADKGWGGGEGEGRLPYMVDTFFEGGKAPRRVGVGTAEKKMCAPRQHTHTHALHRTPRSPIRSDAPQPLRPDRHARRRPRGLPPRARAGHMPAAASPAATASRAATSAATPASPRPPTGSRSLTPRRRTRSKGARRAVVPQRGVRRMRGGNRVRRPA